MGLRGLLWIAVVVAACRSNDRSGPDAAADAPVVAPDARVSTCRLLPPDAGLFDGPGCGCAIGDRACPSCRGVAGACASCGGGIGCGEGVTNTNACDGPEDCQAPQVCCPSSAGGTSSFACRDAAQCMAPVACHASDTCGAGETCCDTSPWVRQCKASC